MENAKCLAELDEVLKFLNYDDLIKIPEDIRNAINKEKDKQYIWYYDETKSLNEQNINRKTVAMLSYLNMKYLLNEEQKVLMERLHEFNEQKSKKERIIQYNSDEIFRGAHTDSKQSENMLIEAKNDKWYKKIFLFFRKILKK